MKRLLKEKLCAWTLAGVTLFTTVIPSSGMVYADTGTVSGTDGVETQTSEDTTMGKVAFKLPESGGSITVNVEKSETQKDSTVIDIDDSGKTVVSVNGTESVVEPTEDGYSYVMEEALGTELEVILQCDEGWDVGLYRVLSDSGDVLESSSADMLEKYGGSNNAYVKTLTVLETSQVVAPEFVQVETESEVPVETVSPEPTPVETASPEPTPDADVKESESEKDEASKSSTTTESTAPEESNALGKTENVEDTDTDAKEEMTAVEAELAKVAALSKDPENSVWGSFKLQPDGTYVNKYGSVLDSNGTIVKWVEPESDLEDFYIEVPAEDDTEAGITPFSISQPSIITVSQEQFSVFDDVSIPYYQTTDPRLNIGLKYVVNDDSNADSQGKWRMVYCAEYLNASPTNVSGTWSNIWSNKRVTYATYYGCMYWGEFNRYAPYSIRTYGINDWRYDYFITQWAVHILNNEITLSQFEYAIKHSPNPDSTLENNVYTLVAKMVNDARDDGNYKAFNSAGWLDLSRGTYSTSDSAKTLEFTKSGDYYYSPWITPSFVTYASSTSTYSADEFVDSITFSGTSDGVTIERNEDDIKNKKSTMARFRVRLTEAAYSRLAGTTLTITSKISGKSNWCTGMYTFDGPEFPGSEPGDGVQDIWMYTCETGVTFQKSSNNKFSIPKSQGKAYITKSSSNTTVVSGNSNYSLDGAEYGIYTSNTCTANTKVSTLTTKNGGTTDTVELTAGTYYVKEITPPKGYILDTTVYTCKVTQGSTTKVEVKDAPRTVTINLTKTSGNTDVTNGNANYKLDGAVYGLYNNSSCTDLRTKLTTNASGKASVTGLPLGTYWIKEITPSQGYDLDTTVHKVEATSGTTNVVTKSVSSVEPPKTDPVTILLKKVDAETGNTAQGNATLEGAQFEVKFYSQRMDTDPGAAGHTPLRTWVFQAKENPISGEYEVQYLNSYLISGDALFMDGSIPSLPFGTITIKEIVAPNGYLLNDETFVVKVGDTLDTPVYHEPTIEDPALSIDIKKVQSGTSYPIEGVTFKHSGPDGFTEKAVTDANGNVSFNGLTHGNHTIEEIETVDGFALNTQKITFTVNRDNSIKITSGSTETDTNGNITVTVGRDGNIDATVENKPAPFDLHIYKINNHDFALQGAEFTLYSDDHCTQVVDKQTTDTAGNLTFQDLIVGKTYYMKETKAPQGYRIPVNDDGSDIVWTIKAESYPTEGTFNFIVNGVTYTDKSTGSITVTGTTADRIANMTVVNEVGLKLPNTGSNMMILLVMAGVALMAGAIVISGTHNMKKKRMEE